MKTPAGQLTFCTNIFPGEDWETHFTALKAHLPAIKQAVSPTRPMGIGLRLSNKASLQLAHEERLQQFQQWLKDTDCYIFTMNGFPYGQFHHSRVKDQVHAPDWTSDARLQYTLRLFRLLAALIPEGMHGGVSTAPLSYKPWFAGRPDEAAAALEKATWQVITVISALHRIHRSSGQMLHLDIEPEADGMIASTDEFIRWYTDTLLPTALPLLQEEFSLSEEKAEALIRDHLRICFDVCHCAVGFESIEEAVSQLTAAGIRIGKWQLSAALNIRLRDQDHEVLMAELQKFDEPVYLHQVVTRQDTGLRHFTDLSPAIQDSSARGADQWRSHFHVPLFISDYGLLGATQQEVCEAIKIQMEGKLCDHLEIETYTWDVLPDALKLPIGESIIREIKWVLNQIHTTPSHA